MYLISPILMKFVSRYPTLLFSCSPLLFVSVNRGLGKFEDAPHLRPMRIRVTNLLLKSDYL